MLFFELFCDESQRSLRLFGRNTGFQFTDTEKPAIVTHLKQIRILLTRIPGARRPHRSLHHHRHIEIANRAELQSIKTTGQHTDDGKIISIQEQLTPDYVWIRSKTSLPQTLADHGDRMRAGSLVVFGPNYTAQLRAHADHVEEITGNDRSVDKIWLIVVAETGRDATPCDQTVQDIVLIAQCSIVRIGKDAARWSIENKHEAIGIDNRKRPHERGIDHA